jgi:hypothetical protein
MKRELVVGMHLVFIDADRVERDALLLCIHGDPKGRLVCPRRKPAPEGSEDPYVYDTGDDGVILNDYKEAGEHWPCINLVVVDKNQGAEDQYGRQTVKEGVTSVVHWTSSTARGFCWRFPGEEVTEAAAPTIK